MSLYAAALDQLAGIQSEVTFNTATAALAKAALFGVKDRETNGLRFTVYGGRLPTDSGPLAIADQTLTLTASATNYIYADNVGIIHKVTSAPTGWPGPLASSARALYQLTVGANAITSGTCWNVGVGQPGPTGPTGATGPAGAELWLTRKRIMQVEGHGGTTSVGSSPGFADFTNVAGSSPGTISADSSTFIGSVAQMNYGPGVGTNLSAGRRTTNNLFTLGNAAGRGGFDITFRFGCTSTNPHQRIFMGLFDCSGGDPTTTVDPSALTNIIGVGGDDGDTNLSFMVNDASGTATKTALGANFPYRGGASPAKVYEARFWADANASVVNYAVTEVDSGNTTSGTASSNIPAGTAFLGWLCYVNSGSNAGGGGTFRFMQVAANSRY